MPWWRRLVVTYSDRERVVMEWVLIGLLLVLGVWVLLKES
jgi:hypothetical protein